MNTVLFTDHPDSGKSFLIETDAPARIMSSAMDAGCYTSDAIVNHIRSNGFIANPVSIKITHVYDMPNAILGRVYN